MNKQIDYNNLTPLQAINMQTETNEPVIGQWNNKQIQEFNKYIRLHNDFYNRVYFIIGILFDKIKEADNNLSFVMGMLSLNKDTNIKIELMHSHTEWKQSIFYDCLYTQNIAFLSVLLLRLKRDLAVYYFLKEVLKLVETKTKVKHNKDLTKIEITNDLSVIMEFFYRNKNVNQETKKQLRLTDLSTYLIYISDFSKECLILQYQDILEEIKAMKLANVFSLNNTDITKYWDIILKNVESQSSDINEVYKECYTILKKQQAQIIKK